MYSLFHILGMVSSLVLDTIQRIKYRHCYKKRTPIASDNESLMFKDPLIDSNFHMQKIWDVSNKHLISNDHLMSNNHLMSNENLMSNEHLMSNEQLRFHHCITSPHMSKWNDHLMSNPFINNDHLMSTSVIQVRMK